MQRYILLCLFVLGLSSCGATGNLLGTIARAPVDLAGKAVGRYQEDNTDAHEDVTPYDISGSDGFSDF